MSAVATERPAGRYDAMARRVSQRKGRERGCWVYIPAEELEAAGYTEEEDPPFYRVWGYRRGSVVIRLYRSR